ncbi:MAG: DUF3309 domain-containing protein [Candidatus Rokuibacteriota bacterium]
MRNALIIALILLVLGSIPAWPYSSGWGYYPSGIFLLVLVVTVIFAAMRRI